MEGGKLRKCASIKSKKHRDQACTYTATQGDYCSRHSKNPVRYKPKEEVAEFVTNTRQTTKAVQALQRFWRRKSSLLRYNRQGPAANDRSLAANQTEVYSLDPLDSIPQSSFFSFADELKTIWAFDIRSLSHLVTETSEIVNPYTRTPLQSKTLKQIHSRIVWLRERKFPILYATGENMSQEQLWNQKVLDVFFKMEALGYRASCRWFDELRIIDHEAFYRRLHRLWTYQLGLNHGEKEAIVPGYSSGQTKLFRQSPDKLQGELHDLRWWRRTTLNLILQFLTKAPQKNNQSLGALYIVMTLVQVVPEAAEAYPWVRESLGY